MSRTRTFTTSPWLAILISFALGACSATPEDRDGRTNSEHAVDSDDCGPSSGGTAGKSSGTAGKSSGTAGKSEDSVDDSDDGERADLSGLMRVRGRQVLDASGTPFVVRGVEMIVGPRRGPEAAREGGVTDVIASTHANAFRPNKYHDLSNAQIAAIIDHIADEGMVPFVTFEEGLDRFNDDEIKEAIQRHPNVILDALLEVEGGFSDEEVQDWLDQARTAITTLRGWGYKNILSIHSLQQGRNLEQVLKHGNTIKKMDPLGNVLMGCQMYWPLRGEEGFEWNEEQGFGRGEAGIREAFRQIAAADFPIQLGFATGDENGRASPNELLLTLAAQHDVGWLWWDWTGNGDNRDSLTDDETLDGLTPAGRLVVKDHPGGFKSAKPPKE